MITDLWRGYHNVILWECTHGNGFKCETSEGLGITIHPMARDRYFEWGWIAYYDAGTFEADSGTCISRNRAIKEALSALKKRGIDIFKLPYNGNGIPA